MIAEIMQEAKAERKGTIARGLQLAESSVNDGGWKEFLDRGRLAVTAKNYPRDHRERRAFTAIMLENTREWVQSLDETTRALQVGGFIDYLFPLVRAAFTSSPIFDLVSIQPLQKKIGLIFFLNFVVGQTKGQIPKGQRVFDVFAGYQGGTGSTLGRDYTSETVQGESLGTGNATGTTMFDTTASTAVGSKLSYLPIRPGSVSIVITAGSGSSDTMTVTDDANGNLVKKTYSGTTAGFNTQTVTGSGSSYVNYETGDWKLVVGSTVSSTGMASSTAVVTYDFNSEISGQLPQIDIQLSSSPIEAISRSMRARYSQDAAFDFRMEFGENLDASLMSALAQFIQAEQTREVVHDLWVAAGAAAATFPYSTYSYSSNATGFNRLRMFEDLIFYIEQAAQTVYTQTQRLHPNWIICDPNAAAIIRSMPSNLFQAAPVDDTTLGVQFMGIMNGRYRVYVDPLLQNESGAATYGNLLLGYKGNEWFNAGYVWAPYQPLYTTPDVTLDDLLTRKAMRMRYAKKLVNNRLYKRVSFT